MMHLDNRASNLWFPQTASRSIRRTSWLSTVIFLCVAVTADGQEMTGAVAGAGILAASGVVDGILEKAGNESNYVVFNAAAQVRLLIENFRLASRDVLESGGSTLNHSQQQAFDNVQKSVRALQKASGQTIEEGRKAVEEIDQIANIITFGDPSPLRSSPTVLAHRDISEIPFTVRGISLDEANPQLSFGSVKARRLGLLKQEAMFSVPSSVFEYEPDRAKLYSGSLTLDVRKCALWIVWCSLVPRHYELAVMALPTRLGLVEIQFNHKNAQRIYVERTFTRQFFHASGDLTRESCNKDPQGPNAPGYFIDVDSITEKLTNSQGGNSHKFLDRSPAGFTMQTCAQAEEHGPSFAHMAGEKINGDVSVAVSWKEYQMRDIVSSFARLTEVPIAWGGSIQDTLPDDTYAILVEVKYFDQTTGRFIGNDVDKYVDVKWDAGTKQLLITSKKPNSVSGIND